MNDYDFEDTMSDYDFYDTDFAVETELDEVYAYDYPDDDFPMSYEYQDYEHEDFGWFGEAGLWD